MSIKGCRPKCGLRQRYEPGASYVGQGVHPADSGGRAVRRGELRAGLDVQPMGFLGGQYYGWLHNIIVSE